MSPRRSQRPPNTTSPAPSASPARRAVLVDCLAAGAWAWALALLSTREHLVDFYGVHGGDPPLWGFLALPAWKLLAILALGVLWAAVSSRLAATWSGLSETGIAGRRLGPVTAWLLPAAVIPLLDGVRSLGWAIPRTFWEPLLLSFLTGMAAAAAARLWKPVRQTQSSAAGRWLALVVLLSAGAAAWWYWEACEALRNYLLGYHDFGHFALRVINTWEGRGWLMETPSLPAFWDHFNPGLVLLAPLWGLWPDVRLFLILQAVSLAAPAPLVFDIARRHGADAPAAAAWSAAYLAIPSVGLLNLCYSYGWHPVSLALPLLFLAAWCLVRGWRVGALLAALLACSFKETVVVVLGCLAAALAIQSWLAAGGWRGRWRLPIGDARLARQLPVAGWLTVWAVLVIYFAAIMAFARFAEFQTSRFSALGNTPVEILLSPVLRPGAFWGQLLRMVSAYFLLGLLVPWHLPVLLRGWPLLLAAVLPIGVLLAWHHGPAFSIAFQYVTELLVVFFLAAVSGAAGAECEAEAADQPRAGQRVAAAGVLAAALTGSWLFGSLPWSGPTLTLMLAQSYEYGDEPALDNPRAVGTPGHVAVERLVAKIGSPDASVLATGRIAAHLLHVRRLEPVDEGVVRWAAFQEEAGAGRAAIEIFDWVLLDRYERFQQSAERIEFVIDQARQAGYRQVYDQHGLILFARPGGAGEAMR